MKIIVTTTYHNADESFLKMMAKDMQERGSINNIQACALRNKDSITIETKAFNAGDPMHSTTVVEVSEVEQ